MPLIKLNNRSIKDVTSLPFAVGNLIHIQSQTANNSASISFTTGINSTYKEYQFWFIDIHPRTDGTTFTFQGSTDGGSNYGINITSTHFSAFHAESGSESGLAYNTDADLAQSTSFQAITKTDNFGNDADHSLGGNLSLFNPASTTYVKHFISRGSFNHLADYARDSFVGGYFNTTSAINAIQFKMSSGNFDGTIALFGVV